MFVQVLPIGKARVDCIYNTDMKPTDSDTENNNTADKLTFEFIDSSNYYKSCVLGLIARNSSNNYN